MSPNWPSLAVFALFCSGVAWSLGISEVLSPSVFSFDSVLGNDSLCLEDSSKPCQSLNLARNILADHNHDAIIEIQQDANLSVVIQLINGCSIQIIGIPNQHQQIPVINCFGNSGFTIRTSENITLGNLKLLECNVRSNNDYVYGYAVGILESGMVNLYNLSISNTSGTAVHFSNCISYISLHKVDFISNGHSNIIENETSFSAGIQIKQDRWDGVPVQYNIERCKFYYNKAPSGSNVSRTSKHRIGYGSGLYAHICGTTANSSIVIQYSDFRGNTGMRGGGIYVYLCENASGNQVTLSSDNFHNNSAELTGGAASFGYGHLAVNNTVQISNCSFINNTAKIGGGLTIFSEYTNASKKQNVIKVTNCSFHSNNGYLSSAVDIAPKDPDQNKNGFLPEITFMDCTFESNTVGDYSTMTNVAFHHNVNREEPSVHHVNSGVVIITRFKVYFGGKTKFHRNSYSALIIVSATVELLCHSNMTFTHNKGYDGGAIGIYGFSQVTLAPYLNLTFIGNHALNHGGAVVYRTIDQHNLISGRNCFFQHSEWHNKTLVYTTHVIFSNNTADVAGNSIYSESFADCYHQCFNSESGGDDDEYYSYDNITTCLGDFKIYGHNNQLVSGGRTFEFHRNFTDTISVIPGSQGTLSFRVVDDFNQTVNPLMSVNSHRPNNGDVVISNKYTLSSNVTPTGVVGATANFTFTVIGVRQIYFYFAITLLPCPPGFFHDSKSKTCVCATDYYSDLIGCVGTQAKVKLGLWVGYITNHNNHNRTYKDLYFSPCATPLCKLHSNYSVSDLLPSSPDNLSLHVCAKNRNGILCGRCSEGHSTYYHSRQFNCQPNTKCHLGSLFYVLSELLPMIIFFIVVIIFDLSLTSGTSVGFIFFTQYLDKLTIHIDPVFTTLRTPYRLFYGLFNFEFFTIESISFCPWVGSQIMDVLALKYITIALALCLVLTLIALLHNNCCGNICHIKRHISANTSVVHGLSAFLVICYAQSSRTTFYILKYSSPSGYNGTKASEVYSYYGGLPYFKRQHLVYAIPALICLVFITILPPLILLFYPLTLQLLSLCKLSEHQLVLKTLRIIRIHKLIPFIDCFQSCYQDKYRCFAGIYFVYRIIILICFSLDPNRIGFHIYSEFALVTFLGIHCLTQPYKKRLHNILDSLVFFNLALINGMAIVTEQLMEYINANIHAYSFKTLVYIISSFQLVLLYLPMLAVIGFFVHKTYSYGCKKIRRRHLDEVSTNDVLEYSRNFDKLIQPFEETSALKRYGSVTSAGTYLARNK